MYVTSLNGMQNAQIRLDTAAARIAIPSATDAPTDSVDLSAEAVALLQVRNDFTANAKALQVQDDVMKSLLDSIN